MNIAKQRTPQALLIEDLHRLKKAQKIARSGHIDLDLVTRKFIWSDETYQIHGCNPETFEPTFENTLGFLHPEDAESVKKELNLAMTGLKKYESLHRIIDTRGETLHVSVNADITKNASGEPVRMLGTITDITDIIATRQREGLRTQILELLAKDTPLDILLDTMLLGVEQYSPGTMCSILLLDKTGKQLVHGAAPNLPDFYIQAIDGGKIGPSAGSCGTAAYTGKRIIVEDIQTHPYWAEYKSLAQKAGLASCWSEPIKNAAGKILGSFAIYNAQPSSPRPRDIQLIENLANLSAIVLERFYASAALKESEEKYRELIDQASDGIFIFDGQGFFLSANVSACTMTGYSKDEIKQMGLKDIIHPKDLIEKPLKLKELLSGKHLLFERKIQRKDGSLFDAEVSAKMINKSYAHAIMRDISKRKEAELAIRESEQRLTVIFDSTPDMLGLVKVDQNGQFITGTVNKSSKAMVESLGIDLKDFIGMQLKSFCIEYLGFSETTALDLEKKYNQVVKNKKPVKVQTSFQDVNGKIIYVETTLNPVFGPEGTVQQVLYVTRDITEEKKTQSALKESERKLALTLDSTVDMMGLVDFNENGEFTFNSANRAVKDSFKLLQNDEKDYFGAELKSYCTTHLGFSAEEALALEKKYLKVVNEKKSVKTFSSSPTPEGKLLHFETTINPVIEEDGIVRQVLWVNKDVTDIKETEERLKISEQKLNEAQKIAKIGSWEYDFATQAMNWSVEQYRILELEGTPPDQLLQAFRYKVHPDDFPKFEQFDKQAIKTGKNFSYEYRIICNDKSIKYILTIGEPVKDLNGKVIGLKGTDQDITHKVLAQKKLLQSMMSGEEKERKRFAAELHDGVGQTLSLISLNLDSVLNLEGEKPDLSKRKLQSALEMVNQTIQEIRTIAHGLTPPALEDYGLQSVLENMLNKAHQATGIEVDYSFDDETERYNPNIEINIYRIAQEALNNTLKHAKAQKISMKIFKKDGFLSILYKDDGKGFDPGKNKKMFNGLKNIENRVYVMAGTLSVHTLPNQGTALYIKIPV